MAAASNHPRILIPKYGQMDNVKPLTANRGLPFAVRWPNLDLRVSIGYDLPWVLATFLARFPVSVTARGFRLWPKMWRPSANIANFRRTREKPLVPRVVMICCWHITDLNIKLIITIWPLLHLGLCYYTDRTFIIRLDSKCFCGWDVYDTWVQFFGMPLLRDLPHRIL